MPPKKGKAKSAAASDGKSSPAKSEKSKASDGSENTKKKAKAGSRSPSPAKSLASKKSSVKKEAKGGKVSNPPSKGSAGTPTPTNPASRVSHASQPSDDERQQKMLVKKLVMRTMLDEQMCEDALVVCNWDYEEAKRMLDDQRGGATPTEAFASQYGHPQQQQYPGGPGPGPGTPEPHLYEDLPPPPMHAGQTHASYMHPGHMSQTQMMQNHSVHGAAPASPQGIPQPLPRGPSYRPSPPAQHGGGQMFGNPMMAGLPQFPDVTGMPGGGAVGVGVGVGGAGAPPVTAEQLISAISQQPWLLPGVLGGMAAHQQMQPRREASKETSSDETTVSTYDEESELLQSSKPEAQVQFRSSASPARRQHSVRSVRSARPSYDRSSDMDLLLEKVKSIELALAEKATVRKEPPPEEKPQMLPAALAFPDPPPPPPPLPTTPRGLLPHQLPTPAFFEQRVPGGGGGGGASPRAGPPAAHREVASGEALPGAAPPAPSVLGGFLSALQGGVPVTAMPAGDTYAQLLGKQQSLLDQTKDKQEKARIAQLEHELEAMKGKLLQSQRQQIKQLEVVRSIQEQVNEDRRDTDAGLTQLDGVTSDVQMWADDLYTKQKEHIERRRNTLLDDTREKQRQLARAIESGNLASVADVTHEHKELVERAGHLAQSKAQYAREHDPIMHTELQDGLGGIGRALTHAQTRQERNAETLSSLALAMGGEPAPKPEPPPPPPPPPPPWVEPPSPPALLAPPHVQQQQPQQQQPSVTYAAPAPAPEAVAVPGADPAVLGELQTLKDVLRLLLQHQMEQSHAQEDMLQQHNEIMQQRRLEEVHSARKSTVLLQGLAQQQQLSIQREREARTLEQELAGHREKERRHTARSPRTPRTRSRSSARRNLERASKRDSHTRSPPRSRALTPKSLRRSARESPSRRFAQDALELSHTRSPRAEGLQRSLHSISDAVQQLKRRPGEHAPPSPRSSVDPASSTDAYSERRTPRGYNNTLPQPHLKWSNASQEPPAPPAENPHKSTLIAFYKKHNPAKIPEVETILDRFKGHYNVLFHSLAKTYNIKANPHRDRLIAFYSKYNPDKLCEVDVILHLAEGREQALLKYVVLFFSNNFQPTLSLWET